jgi:RNAse (barnase) inhibitor barstar
VKEAQNHTIVIDTTRITDENSFHDLFSDTFGFMDGYGRNWDAWIDIMGSMTDPHPGLSEYRIEEGQTLTLRISEAISFHERCPVLYNTLYDCTNSINESYLRQNEHPPIIIEDV